jgi:hypothetical protein
MPDLTEADKLRALLPHWIEHNQEHAEEFRNWSTHAGKASEDIKTAAERMEAANDALRHALTELGGPIDFDHHSHS